MNIYLKEITKKDRDLFKNIYQLYLYDLSLYTGDQLQENGMFYDNSTDLYLREKDLIPLFIVLGDQIQNENIVGFILLQSGIYTPSIDIDYYIGEFFIINRFRNKGYGMKALKEVFKFYQGRFMVGELSNNYPAINFWSKALARFAEKDSIKEEIEIMEDCSYDYLIQKFLIKKRHL